MRYIIRSVREREHWLPEVQEQIPQLEIARDFSRNAMDTLLLAFLQSEGDPAVHLEDDVQLTGGFLAKIEEAIVERPDKVIQFFSRNGDDAAKGSRLMSGRGFMYTLCFYLPPGYAQALHSYYPTWPRRRERYADGWIDTLVGDWLGARRERYWLHVPSLVQHRDGKSTIGRRAPNERRQSETFRP